MTTQDDDRVFVDSLIAALQPGATTVVSYLHDDWCARPDGGSCTCDPEVVVTPIHGSSEPKAQEP